MSYEHTFTIPSLWFPLCILAYSIISSNYATTVWVLSKLYHDSSVLMLVCVFGMFYILNRLTFTITVSCSFNNCKPKTAVD